MIETMSHSNGEPRKIRTEFGEQIQTAGVVLPEGAQILEAEAGGESMELALDLARKGASDRLIMAVGGAEAVSRVHAILAEERGDDFSPETD